MNKIKVLFSILFLLFVFLPEIVLAADSFQVTAGGDKIPVAGKEYKILKSPVNGNNKSGVVTVQEFFSYQCEHCYVFNDDLLLWKKRYNSNKVKVSQVPVFFDKSMKHQALMFYALHSMGLYEKVSPGVFQAVQQGQRLGTVSAITDFLHKHYQLDPKKFLEVYNSFDVAREAGKAKDLMMAVSLNAIPALLINGRYLTNPQMAGGSEEMLKVADYLIRHKK